MPHSQPGGGGGATYPTPPGSPPPQYITQGYGRGARSVPNPAYQKWQQQEAAFKSSYSPAAAQYWYNQGWSASYIASAFGRSAQQVAIDLGPGASENKYNNGPGTQGTQPAGTKYTPPKSGGQSQPQPSTGNYHVDPNTGDIYDSSGNLVGGPDYRQPGGSVSIPYGGGGGGGGGGSLTAYEQAQIALDKQKLADAEAQQKADQAYRQAQALDTFNKNWQDYQTKNYYGSFYGPAAAAPAGAPTAFKLPEPDFVQQYYANNPKAGPDPFQSPIPYSGYSGSGFLNPQQPGIQNAGAIPVGATPAPIAGNAAPAQPFQGVSQGQLPGFNPNQAQSGQNVPAAGASPMGSTSMGLHPDLLNAIQSHPAANQFVMSLPGASEFLAQRLGTQQPSVAAPITGAAGAPANGK